jgi:hypothetical protein
MGVEVLYTEMVKNPGNEVALMLRQLASALTVFIGMPLVFIFFFGREEWKAHIAQSLPIKPLPALLTLALVLAYFPFSGFLVGWNKQMVLPWPELEASLRAMENSLAEMSAYMMRFEMPWHFLLGLLVVAIIPGIGEELMFRGLVQPMMQGLLNNKHAGIWASACLFSAFHMQFYGFFPRLILGALFGYLVHWSGKLSYAMVAHAFNNGMTLLLIYLSGKALLPISIEAMEAVPVYMAIVSVIVTAGLSFLFAKKTQ